MASHWQVTDCAAGAWGVQIGDPGLVAWLVVAGYGVAAAICAGAALRAPLRAERVFCACLTLLLLFMMVNKQLDLQTALTRTVKCVARAQGWYAARATVKLWFVLGLGAAASVGGIVVLRALRGHLARLWPGALGLVVLAGFVVLRAAESHALSRGMSTALLASGINLALELCGILLLAGQGALVLAHARRAAPPVG